MTTTRIVCNDGRIVSRNGTSAFVITAVRDGDRLDVDIDFDTTTKSESAAMVATLLVFLEEQFGEGFVTVCLGHYALDTHKEFMEAGDHQIVMLRGDGTCI